VDTPFDNVAPNLVRRATPEDTAAEGIRPEWFAEPRAEVEVAALLEAARRAGIHVLPRGGGSKLTWGMTPPAGGLLLSMRKLDRVLEHAAGDMTVTVEAGCRIAALEHSLAQNGQPHGVIPRWRTGQRLAVDPLWPEQSTIGGVIATNDTGPLRAGFGSLRDLLLGVTVALPDGTLARSGGKVVKNVAGYDLPKLMIGAFGTLGVITKVTFRLHPVPRAVRTMMFAAANLEDAQRFFLEVQASGPPLTGLQVVAGSHEPCRVAVRLEGSPAGVHASAVPIADIATRCGLGVSTETLEPWRERERISAMVPLLKVTFLPSQFSSLCKAQGEELRTGYWKYVAQGVGVGLLAMDPCFDEACAERVAHLAQRVREQGGSLVVLKGHVVLKERLVREWNPDSLPLMRAVKRQFDPDNVLNPGRFVGGL
jgi:glycolate oxidase FAD binding subunit